MSGDFGRGYSLDVDVSSQDRKVNLIDDMNNGFTQKTVNSENFFSVFGVSSRIFLQMLNMAVRAVGAG